MTCSDSVCDVCPYCLVTVRSVWLMVFRSLLTAVCWFHKLRNIESVNSNILCHLFFSLSPSLPYPLIYFEALMLGLDIAMSSMNWPLSIVKCACSLFWTYLWETQSLYHSFHYNLHGKSILPLPLTSRHLCIQSGFLEDGVHVGMAGHVLKMPMLRLMWMLLKLFPVRLTSSSKEKLSSLCLVLFPCLL